MRNTVSVVRLPGREEIPVKSLSLSIDANSWAWGFSANVPYAAFGMIEPTSQGPVEIEMTINGHIWTMLVEGFDIRREFGKQDLTLQGRSLAAWLAEPYAPQRSFVAGNPFTAQQLAMQELDRVDLVTGFTLDWQLPDWLVPGGAFSYESLAPMGVICQIVGSVGGVLNAHPSAKVLNVRSRYPILPWEWDSAVPDISLPLDVVKTLNLKWSEKPLYNAVYVSGERYGVVGHVVRTGTAGDLVAPMVADQLITHADAARERGRAILADTGRQAMVTLELPMLDSIGLLEPGCLVSVGIGQDSWRGLVRSTSVAANWGNGLTVRQTVEIERHL